MRTFRTLLIPTSSNCTLIVINQEPTFFSKFFHFYIYLPTPFIFTFYFGLLYLSDLKLRIIPTGKSWPSSLFLLKGILFTTLFPPANTSSFLYFITRKNKRRILRPFSIHERCWSEEVGVERVGNFSAQV